MKANSISVSGMNKNETRTGLRRSVFAFTLWSVAVLVAVSILVHTLFEMEIARELFVYSMPLIVSFYLFTSWKPDLFRRPSGDPVERFETANILTASRLFLVPSIIVLLTHDLVAWALVLYCVSLATDIADGHIARKFRQETMFGLVLDPFCDIASTFAVVTWLWTAKAVPGWLYILLIARYSEFFAGMIVLKVMGKSLKLRATVPGKIAGVIQGTAIMILLLKQLSPGIAPGPRIFAVVIFPMMALAFLSVILSQTRIGIETVREERNLNFRR